MAKRDDMTKKTDQELAAELAATRVELHKLRFEAAGARPKDSSAPRRARKTVARILTEQRRRVLANAR